MASRIEVDTIEPEEVPRLPDKERLLEPLNRFMLQVSGALNGGLTPGNFAVEERTVEVVAPEEWVPLTAENSFADIGAASSAGGLAVRKLPDGTAELREAVNRPAGAPAAFTVITSLPAGYGPVAAVRRVADAAGAHGVYDVVPASGSTPAQVRWLAGTPTASFWLCGGTWEAADRTFPAWEKAVRVALGSPSAPFPGRPKWVLVTSAVADDGSGVRVPPTVPSFTFTPATQQERALLSIPRINGLTPGVRYTLTLLVVAE
jgi:hypothetical protein